MDTCFVLLCIPRLMSISAGQGDHVSELMMRTRRFLDSVEAVEAEKARLEMLEAAMGRTSYDDHGEGEHTVSLVFLRRLGMTYYFANSQVSRVVVR